MVSVQVVLTMHRAVLLIIRRSWVRAPPAHLQFQGPVEKGRGPVRGPMSAAAVLAVAGIAPHVSYWLAYAVMRAYGGSGITARLEPVTIDGLVYASSMVILYAAGHRVSLPSLARWLLMLSIAPPSPRTWPRAGRTVPSGGGRGLAGGQSRGLV